MRLGLELLIHHNFGVSSQQRKRQQRRQQQQQQQQPQKAKLRLLADELNMASSNGTQVNKTNGTGGNATAADTQNWTNDTSTTSVAPAAEQASFNSTSLRLNNTGSTGSISTSKPLRTTIAPAVIVNATTRRPTAAPRAFTYPKPAPTHRNNRPTWSPMQSSPSYYGGGTNTNVNESDNGSGIPPALIVLLVVLFIVGGCLYFATRQSNSPSRKYDGHVERQKQQHYSHRHKDRGTTSRSSDAAEDVIEAAMGVLEVILDSGSSGRCGS